MVQHSPFSLTSSPAISTFSGIASIAAASSRRNACPRWPLIERSTAARYSSRFSQSSLYPLLLIGLLRETFGPPDSAHAKVVPTKPFGINEERHDSFPLVIDNLGVCFKVTADFLRPVFRVHFFPAIVHGRE